jgi:hypothetical protein
MLLHVLLRKKLKGKGDSMKDRAYKFGLLFDENIGRQMDLYLTKLLEKNGISRTAEFAIVPQDLWNRLLFVNKTEEGVSSYSKYRKTYALNAIDVALSQKYTNIFARRYSQYVVPTDIFLIKLARLPLYSYTENLDYSNITRAQAWRKYISACIGYAESKTEFYKKLASIFHCSCSDMIMEITEYRKFDLIMRCPLWFFFDIFASVFDSADPHGLIQAAEFPTFEYDRKFEGWYREWVLKHLPKKSKRFSCDIHVLKSVNKIVITETELPIFEIKISLFDAADKLREQLAHKLISNFCNFDEKIGYIIDCTYNSDLTEVTLIVQSVKLDYLKFKAD